MRLIAYITAVYILAACDADHSTKEKSTVVNNTNDQIHHHDSLNVNSIIGTYDSSKNAEIEYWIDEDTCSHKWTSQFEDYATLKAYSESLRKQLYQRYIALRGEDSHLFLDSVGHVYGLLIAKEFIPHWLGTGWTYNGHTDIPKEGTVACGYLVSTIFKHSGININRYKLAQQAASNGAKTILGTNRAPNFVRYDAIFDHLNGLPDGLYKVGLNNHTGFLWLENMKAYFLHSTFIGNEGVKIEDVTCSMAFNYSSIFQIVPISNNHFLIKKWLSGNAVRVITQ